MREILFRGKRTDNGEWEYGDLWCNPYGKRVVCIVSPINEQGTTGGNEVEPETVGQYTGLKDKKGKKIFEGDIVKIPLYESFREQVIAVVAWDIKKAVFYLHGKRVKTDFYHYFGNDCEIIGKIYDNPEMIGGTNNG